MIKNSTDKVYLNVQKKMEFQDNIDTSIIALFAKSNFAVLS